MSYYVYIISTKRRKKLITYTGYTKNLSKRILLHNNGKGAKFTRGGIWKLIYKKRFNSKNKAIKYECFIKNNRSFKIKLTNKTL